MTLEQIGPYIAGIIGTILGIVNLARDIHRNRERVTIYSCPVIRTQMLGNVANLAAERAQHLGFAVPRNTWSNIGLQSQEAVTKALESKTGPHLISFEVTNLSTKSIFIYEVGLSNALLRKKYGSEHFSAIASLKAELVEGQQLEVKAGGRWTTYLFIDGEIAEAIKSGWVFPFVETTSSRKRVWSESETLISLMNWLKYNNYDWMFGASFRQNVLEDNI